MITRGLSLRRRHRRETRMQLRTVVGPVIWAAVAALIGSASPAAAGDSGVDQRLSFDVREGLNLNSFLREGPVAAHLLLRSGHDPRILVAFPAGNSGVGLWFSHSNEPL